jgi:hypothetical protein
MYPFWLDFDEKIDGFVKILEKVKLVQRIFTMAETMGPGKIAYTLQQEGSFPGPIVSAIVKILCTRFTFSGI